MCYECIVKYEKQSMTETFAEISLLSLLSFLLVLVIIISDIIIIVDITISFVLFPLLFMVSLCLLTLIFIHHIKILVIISNYTIIDRFYTSTIFCIFHHIVLFLAIRNIPILLFRIFLCSP